MRDKCFVIMPFGKKALPGESEATFDFDKVYRVIIRRAIESAGMEPIRADEQSGSHIIHSDMFKELRDRAVVLADLSLNNPNVYYELGIRHVLSPGGTVLICRKDTELPFDVRLSRVVFYRYNGVDLDWDVVEDAVPRLKAALETAKLKKPDSPVHALLERVFPEPRRSAEAAHAKIVPSGREEADLSHYQQLVADIWRERGESVAHLVDRHGASVFGARSLGELCFASDPAPLETARVARILYGHGQYEMACRLFRELKKLEDEQAGYELSTEDLIYFGSAVSERDPTLEGAEAGIAWIEEGLRRGGDDAEAEERFRLLSSLGGLLMWKWRLARKMEILDQAVARLKEAGRAADEMVRIGGKFAAGRVAKLHLRLLVALRQRHGTTDRPDEERHRDAIIALDEGRATDGREASYLRWYKAIGLADAGDEEGTRDMVFRSVREDAVLGREEGELGVKIGGEQYRVLRRFVEDNLASLNNHALLGQVSQALQYASDDVVLKR